jgi:hypothetical protein
MFYEDCRTDDNPMKLDAKASVSATIITNIMNSYAVAAIVSSFTSLKKGIAEFIDDSGKNVISTLKTKGDKDGNSN